MASKKVTLAIPQRLHDALVEFAPQAGYRGVNDLLIWCAFYSVIVGQPHYITAPIANASRDVQDMFVNDILDKKARGELKERGAFFKYLTEDIIDRLGLKLPPEVIHAIAAELVRTRRKAKSPAPPTPPPSE